MTLILSVELGGVMVAMTSDTRQVIELAGKRIPYPDAKEPKVTRITPYCIFGGGGDNLAIKVIKQQLTESIGEALFISDIVEPLKGVVHDLPSNTIAQLTISGFNEDGATGVIWYDTDSREVNYRVYEYGQQGLRVIAPSEDEVNAILEYVKFPAIADVSELPTATLSYLSSIQAANYQVNSEAVSETCNYTVLYREPDSGEFKYFEGSLKVNE